MTFVSDEKWRPFNRFFCGVGLRTYQHPCISCNSSITTVRFKSKNQHPWLWLLISILFCFSSWVRQTSHTWSSSWTAENIARLSTNKPSSSWSKHSSGTQAGSGLKAVDLLHSTRSKRNWILRNRTGQCYLVSPAGRKLTFVREK